MKPTPNLVCPLCGNPNECAAARSGSFDVPCWCVDVAIDAATLARIPAPLQGVSCLCPQCAAGGEPGSAKEG
jgi:hypothetical protein